MPQSIGKALFRTQDRQGRRRRPKGAEHRQGRDQATEHRHQRPAAEVGQAGRPGERRQRPPAPGVAARGTTAGDLDQVRAEPTPLAETPGAAPAPVPPLTAPPLITAPAVAVRVCRPTVAVKNGVTSGSVRSTTAAVPHCGHRYAPDAPHQSQSQSQRQGGDMVDLQR